MLTIRERITSLAYILPVALLLSLFLYPMLHEMGHLIAAGIFGGKIDGLSLGLFRASAFFSGNFSNFQNAIIYISGASLPYIIWLIFIVSVPRFSKPPVEIIKIFTSVMCIGTWLPWVFLPILNISGKAPLHDDTIRFVSSSGIGNILAAIIFSILIILSSILFLNRTKNIKKLFESKII